MRADWTELGWGRVCCCCFLGTGSLLWCPVFSLSLPLFRCQFACRPSLSVCFFGVPTLCRSANIKLKSHSLLFITELSRVLQQITWQVIQKNWLLWRSAEVCRIWPQERKVDLHASLKAHSCWLILSGTLNCSVAFHPWWLFVSGIWKTNSMYFRFLCVWSPPYAARHILQ